MDGKQIRQELKKAGLYQWQVAYAMNVTEATFIRWLRKPLPAIKEQAILETIALLSLNKEAED